MNTKFLITFAREKYNSRAELLTQSNEIILCFAHASILVQRSLTAASVAQFNFNLLAQLIVADVSNAQRETAEQQRSGHKKAMQISHNKEAGDNKNMKQFKVSFHTKLAARHSPTISRRLRRCHGRPGPAPRDLDEIYNIPRLRVHTSLPSLTRVKSYQSNQLFFHESITSTVTRTFYVYFLYLQICLSFIHFQKLFLYICSIQLLTLDQRYFVVKYAA